jgi:hypothetical protein
MSLIAAPHSQPLAAAMLDQPARSASTSGCASWLSAIRATSLPLVALCRQAKQRQGNRPRFAQLREVPHRDRSDGPWEVPRRIPLAEADLVPR